MKHLFIVMALAVSTLFAEGGDEPARVARRTNPQSKLFANAIRSNGAVNLELRINEQGKLSEIRVLDGRPDLLPAAIYAVREWDFSPATVGGRPVDSKLAVTIHFEFGR